MVTVKSGAVAEYLIDQTNAYLVPPNDAAGLADRLEFALQRNHAALIQQALQDAKHYSVEQGCQNLHDYYQQLLGINQRDEVAIPSLPFPSSVSQ
ncbi:MAG: glycosyltransferase [Leptolyngbyaceae cyanobacterium SM1_4_3]|nr:glycosyltransferase [Leptolyngbyaceae cyanobacterium SM1_4_3]